MALETWWLYLGAVVLIACTPGPNVLYVTTRSIRFGLGPAAIGMTGCLVALVLMLTGSVAGLSALLLARPTGTSKTTLFRDGFLVGISNPKLLIFAAAFFPQFIDPTAARVPQFALMVATFVGVELFFYSIYALSGRKLADRLMHGIWRRRLNRASGLVFIGFGAALLRYKP